MKERPFKEIFFSQSVTFICSLSAVQGYKNWVKNNGPEALLPGLNMTNDQLLFVSFAQVGRRDAQIKIHLRYYDSTAHELTG